MMDGTFVKELARKFASPMVISVNGREHLVLPGAAGDLDVWKRDSLPAPRAIMPTLFLSTLDSLVQYVAANRDALPLEECRRLGGCGHPEGVAL